jgi:hypothetical protein
MPDWIQEASLAVILLVAIGMFLRFLQGERTERRGMAKSCHQVHERQMESMDKVVDRNSDAIDTNSRVLGRVDEALRKLNGNPGSPPK